MQVVLLGVDGLDAAAVDRFADDLPTLSALRERGVEAALEPTHPPHRDSVWPSLYTGTDPSHHGVFGPATAGVYPDEADPVSRPRVRRPALWEYLTSEGATTVAYGIPVTHPADPTNGVLVPGPPAPPDEPAFPPGTRDELPEAVAADSPGRAGRFPALGLGTDEGDDAHLERIDRRGRRFAALLEREDWELAACRFGNVESALEAAGTDEDRRKAVYETVDDVVGTVLETVDDDANVLVHSTGGVVPLEAAVYPNQLLAERGLLEPSGDGTAGGIDRAAASGTEPGSTRLLERVRRTVREFTARVGLEGLLPGGPGRHAQSVAWRDSLAFCPSEAAFGVRINRAGREPNGRVPPSRSEAVTEEILDALCGLETPGGEPAFASIRRREERYDGPFVEHAPDLLCRPARPEIAVSPALSGQVAGSAEGYGRTFEGTLLGAGPGIVSDAIDGLSVTDVAPLAMALLGRPVPSLMTGRVPEGLVRDPPIRATYDGVAVGATSDDPTFDDARVAERFEWLDSREWWLE